MAENRNCRASEIASILSPEGDTCSAGAVSRRISGQSKDRVFSLSELLADFFEYIHVEKNSLAPEIREPWNTYMKTIFTKSGAFREFIHTNKTQYSKNLLDFFAAITFTETDLVITARKLESENELSCLDAIYQDCFKSSSVPTEIQKKWWTAHKDGILGLFAEKTLIGGVSFWPLNAEAYDRFKSGQLLEKDIRTEDFSLRQKNNYYISDIAVTETFRHKLYSNFLLRNLFATIEMNADDDAEIKISALAFSESGNKILTGLGFHKIRPANETLDKQDLFQLTLQSKEDLLQLKRALL